MWRFLERDTKGADFYMLLGYGSIFDKGSLGRLVLVCSMRQDLCMYELPGNAFCIALENLPMYSIAYICPQVGLCGRT